MVDMKVILITGASTGIGLAIAKNLLKTHHHLVLTARQSSLPRFAQEGIEPSAKVWIRPLDIRHADERRNLIEEVNKTLGGVDILINNAGIAYRAVLEHATEAELMDQFAVNFRGPMDLIRLVLPKMRQKHSGKIINISSVGGMMAMPTMGAYSASKFALEGASEALYYEVKPWGISVSLIQPGFIHSDAFKKVPYTELSKNGSSDPYNPYYQHYHNMEPFIGKLMDRSPDTPDSVAKLVLKVIKNPKPPLRIAGTLDARFFYYLRRLLPRSLYHWMLYKLLPKVKSWGH